MDKRIARQLFEQLKGVEKYPWQWFDKDVVNGEDKLRINTTEWIVDFIHTIVWD